MEESKVTKMKTPYQEWKEEVLNTSLRLSSIKPRTKVTKIKIVEITIVQYNALLLFLFILFLTKLVGLLRLELRLYRL